MILSGSFFRSEKCFFNTYAIESISFFKVQTHYIKGNYTKKLPLSHHLDGRSKLGGPTKLKLSFFFFNHTA